MDVKMSFRDNTFEVVKKGDKAAFTNPDGDWQTLADAEADTGRGNGPEVTDAKGSAKFWIKDGQLSKFEFKVSGKMDFNGNDFDVDRTTTTEITEVGTTKIELPEGAKKKLEGTTPAAEAK